MRIVAFITVTNPKERGDTFDQCYQSAKGFCDDVVVIDGSKTWPKEFSWELIGNHFQKGYEECDADFVIHLDCDFIFHERDYDAIRKACESNPDAPALSFWKYQLYVPHQYNLKSRLVICVNKGKYGDRIRFNSGGDLCQPSLDGKYITPDSVPEAKIGFYNYEKILKTKEQIAEDCSRMERAWFRHFGKYQMGSDGTALSAYEAWLKMTLGRLSKPQTPIKLEDHPSVMQDTIKGLKPDQWGYNGHNNLPNNEYIVE